MSDNQNNQGAPSSDNTSALFVSARKKQLAEQEQQRVAAEKEAARIAAEEEVRRLEAEVEERKKRAQEDAIRIEQEEIERRKQAEIEKAKINADIQSAAKAKAEQPAVNPITATVAKGSTIVSDTASKINGDFIKELLADKKKLTVVAAAGGGLLLLIIILIIVLSLGGSNTKFTHTLDSNVYVELNEDGTAEGYSPEGIEYSGTWTVSGNDVIINADNYSVALGIIDENTIYDYNYEGEYVFD